MKLESAAVPGRFRRARIAISELFLDTELDDATFVRLRDALLACQLTPVELDHIYYEEVAPVLHQNLRNPAGTWVAFEPDWLEQQIDRQLARRRCGLFAALRRRHVTRSTIDDWRRLRDMIVNR